MTNPTPATLSHLLVQPPKWWRVACGTAAVLLVACLFWQGAQPYAGKVVKEGWDKLAHAVLHFGLCALLLPGVRLRHGMRAVWLCAAVAALDEAAQYFEPGRTPSPADWLASVAGALVALGLAHLLVKASLLPRGEVSRSSWGDQDAAAPARRARP